MIELLIGLFVGYSLGWVVRGLRSVTLEDIARELEASHRDEPIAERVRRVNRR